ncbi:hypothetical protein PSL93_20500, partial [Clostridioides difficile]|uniref:hypothetical protein n=1 Tax=Clostridioides difficile TaxID=1496 RepID=UPI002359D2A1
PWWDSGDYGMKDEQGRLFLQDRQVDLVETIDSTLAIEDKLLDTLTFLDEVVIIRVKMAARNQLSQFMMIKK